METLCTSSNNGLFYQRGRECALLVDATGLPSDKGVLQC